MNWIACMGCNFLFARQNISEVGSNPLRGEVNRTPLVWRTLMVVVNLKLCWAPWVVRMFIGRWSGLCSDSEAVGLEPEPWMFLLNFKDQMDRSEGITPMSKSGKLIHSVGKSRSLPREFRSWEQLEDKPRLANPGVWCSFPSCIDDCNCHLSPTVTWYGRCQGPNRIEGEYGWLLNP